MTHHRPRWILLASLAVLLSCPLAHAQSPSAAQLYNQGIDAYAKGNIALSIQCFEQAVQQSPNHVDALYNLGSVYYQQGNYDKAQQAFQRVTQLNPNDHQARYNLALSLEKSNRLEEAVAQLKQIPAADRKYDKAQQKISQLSALAKQQRPVTEKATKTASTATKPTAGKPELKKPVQTFAKGFWGPTGMAIAPDGAIFVANYSKNRIDKVNANGEKSVFAEGDGLNGPIGLVIDQSNGYLYVANYLKNNVAKVSPWGDISVLASGLNKPYNLLLDNQRRVLYVTEQETNTVSKVALE